MLHARTQVRKKEMDPEPSPPTPSRPERHQRVVVDSSPKASSMSRFQDSVKEVRKSVQNALHLLREMSRTSMFFFCFLVCVKYHNHARTTQVRILNSNPQLICLRYPFVMHIMKFNACPRIRSETPLRRHSAPFVI